MLSTDLYKVRQNTGTPLTKEGTSVYNEYDNHTLSRVVEVQDL